MGYCYIPHGGVMSNWTPAAEGADFELSRTLMPLQPFRDQVVVVSNLAHKLAGAQGPGDSGGDHGRSPSVFLNGVHPKRTEGEDVRAGTTVDQIAATHIGQDTPLPSLELATEDMTGLIGACDVGFSCTYTNTISWRTPTTPLPMEINPRVVFDRLFGDGSSAADRVARIQREHSILDAVTAQVSHLQRGLGANDRNRVVRISGQRARDRAPHPDHRGQEQPEHHSAGYSHRHPGRSCGPLQDDVRFDGAGVPGRHHARFQLHDGARGELPHVPANRRARSVPRHVAPPG